jgi:hypothetical protein
VLDYPCVGRSCFQNIEVVWPVSFSLKSLSLPKGMEDVVVDRKKDLRRREVVDEFTTLRNKYFG